MNTHEVSNLPEPWILTPTDHARIAVKGRANRLSFAVLLLFFRERGRFPLGSSEVDQRMVREVAQQIHVPASADDVLNLSGRTAERHRAEIRALFGYREATVADAEALEAWLRDQAAVVGAVPDHLVPQLEARCRELSIEPPSADRVDRIVRAAIRSHDDRLYAGIQGCLTLATRGRLEALLQPASGTQGISDGDEAPEAATAPLLRLRSDPGRPSLAGVQAELAKLELVRRIGLPADLFGQVLPHELERYRRRVAVEAPYELRRHPEAARFTWLAAFVHLRERELTDSLVDLLIETVHHIGARAERRVDRELLDDLKRVTGKQNLLFELAGAALDRPDGIVRDVVFPVVAEQTLRDLVKEWKATGPTYRTTLRTVIRNSYKGHYRRMVPQIRRALDFRSDNRRHRPVIQALDLLKKYADTKLHTFPAEEDVPIDGVARGLWREAVVEKDAEGRARVNRITYEICALEALRDKLRCKEVWVVGANRYRNPDADVPADFEAQRTPYFQALNLPLEADRFIADLQAEMRQALHALDAGLPTNALVRIRYGGRGIMIYWHVERKSLCIHSQLKSPSSSEVASMIEGVVHHCTEMEVDRQYVDSHGQSTVAFAFCRLLGFQLLPRLKAIHKQKLYRPDVGQPDAYRNLQTVLTKPINWELIRQQYDQMVKYATAVRLGTAETEAILRRFTRNNVQHPTCKAFAELGKAVKTVFLCRYLHDEGLRREIHEGLNVIEQWNGANDFVFFARRGELASNRREDHEVSMLALHLLQNCMIYVNTLMLQQVLAQPDWRQKLETRDLSALTPLIWEHVNPYGRFDLDMNARIPLD